MVRNLKALIPFLVILILITSCDKSDSKASHQVEQRLVFQQYYASYNANEQLFKAQSSFKLNNPSGTSLHLTKNSKVEINGNLMEEDYAENSYVYLYQNSEEKPKKIAFSYLNNDEQLLTNEVAMPMFELKNKSGLTLAKSKGGQLAFEGAGFGDDEMLYFSVYRGNDRLYQLESNILSKNIVTIEPETLTEIAAGNYEIQFQRVYSSSMVNSLDRGGWIDVEYLSKKYKFTITE